VSMEAVIEWAAMGRHGLYVWLAYGTSLVVLTALVLESRWSAARLWQDIEADIIARKESGRS
jgi:heme exporter protein CcmD